MNVRFPQIITFFHQVVALSVLIALIIKDPKAASSDESEGGPRPLGKDEEAQDGKKKKKKKIDENGDEIEEDDSSDEDEQESEEANRKANADFRLPDEKKLEESRQLRLKEKHMKGIIREILIHLMFVMLCLFIGYSNMDPFANGYGQGVKTFISKDLEKVSYIWCYIC